MLVVTPQKRIAIVGTRPPSSKAGSCSTAAWAAIERDVLRVLHELHRRHGHLLCIVSGGAAGVDTLAHDFAIAHDLSRIIIRPNYNPDAGYPAVAAPCVRNQWIVDHAEAMFAWPKDTGRGGTDDAIAKMRKTHGDASVCVRKPWEPARVGGARV